MGIKDRLNFPDIKLILFCWVVTETQGVDTGSWVKVSSWFFFDLQQLRYGISDHFALSVLCFLVVDAETAISYLVVDPISLFSYWLLSYSLFIIMSKLNFRGHCKSQRPRIRPCTCTRFYHLGELACINLNICRTVLNWEVLLVLVCSVELLRYLQCSVGLRDWLRMICVYILCPSY